MTESEANMNAQRQDEAFTSDNKPASANDESGAAPRTPPDLLTAVGTSFLVAVCAALLLHSAKWLCGWGWGSLWATLSSVIILTLGLIPWVLDHEGQKSPASGFGAAVGAIVGAVYGWLFGGLLSGLLFCTSIGTWAAWLAHKKGQKNKLAQIAVVAGSMVAFHAVGMLAPSMPRATHAGSDSSEDSTDNSSEKEGDEANRDFQDGYTLVKQTWSMTPEQRMQYMIGVVEPQVATKKDPKAFRRGMAKAMKGPDEPVAAAGELSADSGKPVKDVGLEFEERATRAVKLKPGDKWGEVLHVLESAPQNTKSLEISDGVVVSSLSTWPSPTRPDDTFVKIVFRSDKFGRPGLRDMWIEAINVTIHGKKLHDVSR